MLIWWGEVKCKGLEWKAGYWLWQARTEVSSGLKFVDIWSSINVVLIWWGEIRCQGLKWFSDVNRSRSVLILGEVVAIRGDKESWFRV